MSAAMLRPVKHPRTGVYYIRRRVPVDLFPAFGDRREIKVSLGTKDLREAKILCLVEAQKMETRFANLRSGAAILTERDALNLARRFHGALFERYRDNPSAQSEWQQEHFTELWKGVPSGEVHTVVDRTMSHSLHPARQLERQCISDARLTLAQEGLQGDDKSVVRLAKAIALALQSASLELKELKTLIVSAKADDEGFRSSHLQRETSFKAIFEIWASQEQRKSKTIYEWKRLWFSLRDFVGVDDVSRLTEEDVRAWRDSLIGRNLNAKTINDSYLAAVKSILRWAVKDKRLATNPAADVSIKVKTSPGKGIRGYNEEEAIIVIRASVASDDPVLRWIPLLLAYTGARLSEICQLRREDVKQENDVWYLMIAAEAGSLKTVSAERRVPLHPATIEQGFMGFVQRSEVGPLFTSLVPSKFGGRGGHATKILGSWVRSLGFTDARLSPNNSWRHRFKTMSRRHHFNLENTNALLGHSQVKSSGANYGDFPLDALYAEIMKIPTLVL